MYKWGIKSLSSTSQWYLTNYYTSSQISGKDFTSPTVETTPENFQNAILHRVTSRHCFWVVQINTQQRNNFVKLHGAAVLPQITRNKFPSPGNCILKRKGGWLESLLLVLLSAMTVRGEGALRSVSRVLANWKKVFVLLTVGWWMVLFHLSVLQNK